MSATALLSKLQLIAKPPVAEESDPYLAATMQQPAVKQSEE
jgi:hypothetical protein